MKRYKKKQYQAQRRAEAEARKEARDQRTDREQLSLLDERSGDSTRERARIAERIIKSARK